MEPMHDALEQHRNKLRKRKSRFRFFIVLFLLLLLSAAGLYYFCLGPVQWGDRTTVNVSIPEGCIASDAVKVLDQAGLVKNPTVCKYYVKILRINSIKAENYSFTKGMSFISIIRAVSKGDQDYVSRNDITINAGDTIPEIAAKIAEATNISSDEVIKQIDDKTFVTQMIDKYWFLTNEVLDAKVMHPLEGYLYPETYSLGTSNIDIQELMIRMLDEMNPVILKYKSAITKMNYTVHQFLTMTSIVTAEGGDLDNDLPTVASVFFNRLKENMCLGSDVTVNYAMGQKVVNITESALNTESPYNTRKFPGLPPGPICSVLDTRMDAVVNHKETDYLFFYATPEGKVIFTKTIEEHNKVASENPWPEDQ